jgi:TonB-linked outer membrane protein, SusC/RagA family/TonB-dependent outer membrane receptor, SusC/RagA subfamily, signature region
MKIIKYFLLVISVLVADFAFAQNISVKGIVTDKTDGSPLVGVYVVIKGENTGVSTDIDGNYVISCKPTDVLIFSYIQYVTQEIPVSEKKLINVALEQDIAQLEELVVVGYGTARKISSVVGATSSVKEKVFKNVPIANAGDALQGQVAGLQVYSNSGEPSDDIVMKIRGVSSINASTTPLYILDGAPIDPSVYTTINSNDIDKITVLKDASSTAIYGARAANGVVYITTKKGRTEKPAISFSAQYGLSFLSSSRVEQLNTSEYFKVLEMIDPTRVDDPQFQEFKNFRINNNIGFDWRKWILKEGAPTIGADLSVSGSTKTSDYYLSLGAFSQDGVLPYSFLKRYNLRTNLNYRLTEWLKIGINLGLTLQGDRKSPYAKSYTSPYNPINIADWSLPYVVPYEILKDENGKFLGYGKELDRFPDYSDQWNYFYLVNLQKNKSNYIKFNGSSYQELNPLKGLVIRTAQALNGWDLRTSQKVLDDKYHVLPTSANEYFERRYNFTSTNTIEYKFSLNDRNIFVLLAGHESTMSNVKAFGASSSKMINNDMNDLDQGAVYGQPSYDYGDQAFNSFFTRLSYDLNSRYFVDLSFRRDGSSLFGKNKRYANFYSLGLMWDLKSEKPLKNISWINKLNLRSSFGTTGNSGIPLYRNVGVLASSIIYDGDRTMAISSMDIPDLTWETVESFDVAVSTKLFNILDLEVDFYNKTTKDMLIEVPFSYATGFSKGWGNVASMVNRGVDLQVNLMAYSRDDMYVSVGGTLNYNKNEIVKLFQGRDEFVLSGSSIKYCVGKSYGDLYTVRYAGVDPANGKQLWYDKNGKITDKYSDDNRVFTGKQAYAPFTAGLNLEFYWKGITASAAFSGVFGKWVMNNSRYFSENPKYITNANGSKSLLNMWSKPGDVTYIPKAGENVVMDSRFIENSSFVRLKNLKIAYSVPKRLLEKTRVLNSANLFIIGRNLLTITRYTGYDPEVYGSNQPAVYPNSKQITFGVELNF